MYTYKHKENGNVITTHGKVSGGNWELVKNDKKGGRNPAAKVKKDEEKQEENGQEEAEA